MFDTRNVAHARPTCRMPDAVWWLLWVSAVVLLSFYFQVGSGARMLLPDGQYLFFAFCLAGTAILAGVLGRETLGFLDRWPTSVPLLAMLGALALSAGNGLRPQYGLRLLSILAVTSLPFLVLGHHYGRRPTRSGVMPLAVVAVGCAVGTVLLEVTGPLTVGDVLLENFRFGETRRWAFLFQEANGLGWMLAIGVGASLCLAATATTSATRLTLLAMVLPLLLAVFVQTNSRASLAWILVYLAGYGVLGFALLLRYQTVKRWPIALAALLAVTACIGVAIAHWDSIASFLRLRESDLTSGRLPVWQRFVEHWSEHPWLGIGFGSAAAITGDLEVKSPLNVYLGVLGESGLGGFLPFLFLWGGGIWQAGRAVARSWAAPKTTAFHLAFFVLLSLVGLGLQQNGEWTVMRISPVHYLFVLLIGAASGIPAAATGQGISAAGQRYPETRAG